MRAEGDPARAPGLWTLALLPLRKPAQRPVPRPAAREGAAMGVRGPGADGTGLPVSAASTRPATDFTPESVAVTPTRSPSAGTTRSRRYQGEKPSASILTITGPGGARSHAKPPPVSERNVRAPRYSSARN